MAIVSEEMIIGFLEENGGQIFYDDLVKAVLDTGSKHITRQTIAKMCEKGTVFNPKSSGKKIVMLR